MGDISRTTSFRMTRTAILRILFKPQRKYDETLCATPRLPERQYVRRGSSIFFTVISIRNTALRDIARPARAFCDRHENDGQNRYRVYHHALPPFDFRGVCFHAPVPFAPAGLGQVSFLVFGVCLENRKPLSMLGLNLSSALRADIFGIVEILHMTHQQTEQGRDPADPQQRATRCPVLIHSIMVPHLDQGRMKIPKSTILHVQSSLGFSFHP